MNTAGRLTLRENEQEVWVKGRQTEKPIPRSAWETKGGEGGRTEQPLLSDVWLTRPSSTSLHPAAMQRDELQAELQLAVRVFTVSEPLKWSELGRLIGSEPAAGLETHVWASASPPDKTQQTRLKRSTVRGVVYTQQQHGIPVSKYYKHHM